MNRIIGVMKTQLQDRFGWIFLPWIIMLSSFTVNLIIGSTMGDESFYTGGLASIYVYMLVLGIMSVVQTFPFLIGFGVRRKDYFWGTSLSICAVSFVSAFALWLLGYVESGEKIIGKCCIGCTVAEIAYRRLQRQGQMDRTVNQPTEALGHFPEDIAC